MSEKREKQEHEHGTAAEPDWLHKHVHDPNPAPPSEESSLLFVVGNSTELSVTIEDLQRLPQTETRNCYIVSTGHGTSGPYTFRGVKLADLLRAYLPAGFALTHADVVSADGFGNRVLAEELVAEEDAPILLATHIDGEPMTRAQGLVRMIVPSERDDALRQVKWIERIDAR